eukprot:748336-Hanusia_phi.AAC.2
MFGPHWEFKSFSQDGFVEQSPNAQNDRSESRQPGESMILLACCCTHRSCSRQKIDIVKYLKSNKDIKTPLRRHMRRLSPQDILREDPNNVDDLRSPAPTSLRGLGPDGLRDEGSLSDLYLLGSLSRENKVDSARMDAVDARHNIPRANSFLALRRRVHDMAVAESKVDSKAENLLFSKRNSEPFHMIRDGERQAGGPPSWHEDEVQDKFAATQVPVTSRDNFQNKFHALTGKSKNDGSSDDADQIPAVDLGTETDSERLADPNPAPLAAPSKGIWIEPGSNKGYDSYALDSLQDKHSA